MNLSFYIAKRYLFSKKKHNAINVISGVSVCGVALATLALVCTLSVFNGFQDMVAGFFTAFDPELKITPREGKVLDTQDERIEKLRHLPEIAVFTETLEENAMVQYKDKQAMVMIKGVGDNFKELTDIEKIVHGKGTFTLYDSVVNYAVMGVELLYVLGAGIEFVDPLAVYAPKRNSKINIANPAASFHKEYLFSPGCVFVVNQQKYDSQYVLTSLNFARNLFEYTSEASAIELRLKPDVKLSAFKSRLEKMLGDEFIVNDRYEQQADLFRMMEVEKLMSYLFLTFILMIACFNIIGSLSMLILDKKEDVLTLRNLGAGNKLITRIFLFEGWLISFFGAVGGILFGLLLCFIQQEFGIISLGNVSGSFLVDAYPVSVYLSDVLLVFITVLSMGFVSVYWPVRHLDKRLL